MSNKNSSITLISFGFKYGKPFSNYYFDISFIKNPARDDRWGFYANVDEQMKKFILDQPESFTFIEKIVPLIEFLSSTDQNNIFAFGCSAGRHRSVVIVEILSEILIEKGIHVDVKHRDMG